MGRIEEDFIKWLENKKKELNDDLLELNNLGIKAGVYPAGKSERSTRWDPYPEEKVRYAMSSTMLIVWRVLKKFGGLSLHPLTTRGIVKFAQQESWIPDCKFESYRNAVRISLKTMRENPAKYPSLRWQQYSNHKRHGSEYFYHIVKPEGE